LQNIENSLEAPTSIFPRKLVLNSLNLLPQPSSRKV